MSRALQRGDTGADAAVAAFFNSQTLEQLPVQALPPAEPPADESERDRKKRAIREFRALLEGFEPHWTEDLHKIFKALLKRHHLKRFPQEQMGAAAMREAAAAPGTTTSAE